MITYIKQIKLNPLLKKISFKSEEETKFLNNDGENTRKTRTIGRFNIYCNKR